MMRVDNKIPWHRSVRPAAETGVRMEPSPGEQPHYPGAANTDHVPYVNIVDYEPVSPVALDVDHPIRFRVRIWDDKPLPANSVILSYASLSDPMALSEVTMHDDGKGGDEVADDTIYTAVVDSPALSGKLIYDITVEDADNNMVRIPHGASAFRIGFIGGLANDHLIITEVVASNRDCRCSISDAPSPEGCELGGLDNYGEANGWIEIMDPTDGPIPLDEYFLTDRLDWLTRWKFPTWAVLDSLAPGERIIVWCDAEFEQDRPDAGAMHANFLLDADHDHVVLVRGVSERQIVDFVEFRNQVPDTSYGRDGTTGEWGVLLEPTLRGENARLAANAEWITELGDPLNPASLKPGCCITVTGKALDQTARVVIVDPMPCEPEEVRNWDWVGLSTPPVEASWLLGGDELEVVLPINLADGPHLLCVLSGPNAASGTWYEGGVPFTRIQFSTEPDGVCGECGDVVVFKRGDSNRDGAMNLADSIYVLQNMFANGPRILCIDAADANDDENVDIADPIYILQNLFANGPSIPAPFPDCGPDTTGSGIDRTGPQLIGCEDYCPEACQDPPVPCPQPAV